MKHPSKPDTQPDEYLPDLPAAHREVPVDPNPQGTGINPIDTGSMPRGERDERTWEESPEYNDRPGQPPRPDTPRRER